MWEGKLRGCIYEREIGVVFCERLGELVREREREREREIGNNFVFVKERLGECV